MNEYSTYIIYMHTYIYSYKEGVGREGGRVQRKGE
jgi:hypothetical protein